LSGLPNGRERVSKNHGYLIQKRGEWLEKKGGKETSTEDLLNGPGKNERGKKKPNRRNNNITLGVFDYVSPGD